MALLTKTHKIVPANELSNELAVARTLYIAKRNSVIERATERIAAIDETIRDLEAEDNALEAIVQEAQKG